MQRHRCAQRNATEAGGRGYPVLEPLTSNPVTPGDRPAGSRLAAMFREKKVRLLIGALMWAGAVLVVVGLVVEAASRAGEPGAVAGRWMLIAGAALGCGGAFGGLEMGRDK